MHEIKFVRLEDFEYQWIYIDGLLFTTGEPISARDWLSIFQKYGTMEKVEAYLLTDTFGEKVGYNYQRVPKMFSEFLTDDLERESI